MKKLRWLGWVIGLWLVWAPSAQAQQVFNVLDQRSEPPSQVLQGLARSYVVYLGETHDQEADHQAELAIIQALYGQNPQLAIGMEMFQRRFQPVLDRYLAGDITEEQLQQQTEYDQRWGYPWAYYAPILRFAKAQGIPVLALNAPSEVIRKVARRGLASLTPEEMQDIPPLGQIRTRDQDLPSNRVYRQRLQDLFDSFHKGQGNSTGFEHFFQAQVLWDETMAERISLFLTQFRHTRQLVVLAGQGHLLYGDGIPRRVLAQWGFRSALLQTIVLINPAAELQVRGERAIADYFWLTQ